VGVDAERIKAGVPQRAGGTPAATDFLAGKEA